MKRPILDFADVMYPGLRNKKVSECTPEESIIAGIAWMADNAEYGIDDAARKLIDEFRAFVSRSHGPNEPWDRVERRKDNWTLILKEYAPKFNFKYTGWKGEEYTFFGLVHAEDDLYYGLTDQEGKVHLASCVGSLDGEHGWYKQIPNGGRCSFCNTVYPTSGPEKCDRYRCPQGDYPFDGTDATNDREVKS